MELFSPKLIDKGKLAALIRVYLELRLPLHAARNAAGADLRACFVAKGQGETWPYQGATRPR